MLAILTVVVFAVQGATVQLETLSANGVCLYERPRVRLRRREASYPGSAGDLQLSTSTECPIPVHAVFRTVSCTAPAAAPTLLFSFHLRKR